MLDAMRQDIGFSAGGLLGALAVAPVMGSFLFGITTRDPVTLLGVIGLLGSVALAACSVPACRAARVNPTSPCTMHDDSQLV